MNKKLDRLSMGTLIYGKAGLINNPNFCIKGQTTCACVCENCMKEYKITLDKIYKEFESKQMGSVEKQEEVNNFVEETLGKPSNTVESEYCSYCDSKPCKCIDINGQVDEIILND